MGGDGVMFEEAYFQAKSYTNKQLPTILKKTTKVDSFDLEGGREVREGNFKSFVVCGDIYGVGELTITSQSKDGLKTSQAIISVPLRKVPNFITDEFNLVDGAKIQKISEPWVINGELNWTILTNAAFTDVYALQLIIAETPITNAVRLTDNTGIGLSDAGNYIVQSATSRNQKGIVVGNTGFYIKELKTVIDAIEGADVLAKFKAYLNTHPVTFFNQFLNNITTQLNATSLTAYTEGNITITGDVLPSKIYYEYPVNLDTSQKIGQLLDIKTEYVRDVVKGKGWYVTTINKTTFDGGNILPRISPCTVSREWNDLNLVSAYDFAQAEDYLCIINAGIWAWPEIDGNTRNLLPMGNLILDGVIKQSIAPNQDPERPRPYTTLGIKADGTLKSYDKDTVAETVLADGCTQALCGFNDLIVNYALVDATVYDTDNVGASNSLVPYLRQVIGQKANGDYVILTADGGAQPNQSEGLTQPECADILKRYNVKFAYRLDEGGSTTTLINKKRINENIESGWDGTGRKISNVIVFYRK